MVHEGIYTCTLEDKISGESLAEVSVPVTVVRKYCQLLSTYKLI